MHTGNAQPVGEEESECDGREAGKGNDEFPKSLDKLAAAGIRLVQADTNDPDGALVVEAAVVIVVILVVAIMP